MCQPTREEAEQYLRNLRRQRDRLLKFIRENPSNDDAALVKEIHRSYHFGRDVLLAALKGHDTCGNMQGLIRVVEGFVVTEGRLRETVAVEGLRSMPILGPRVMPRA